MGQMEPRARRSRAHEDGGITMVWPPEIETGRALAQLESRVDHVRGPSSAPVVLEYGDYQCPYSRQAFRAIEQVERELRGGVLFGFSTFPTPGLPTHRHAAAEDPRATRTPGGVLVLDAGP